MSRASNSIAFKRAFKWQAQSGSLARRVIIRGFIFVVAISALPLLQNLRNVDPSKLTPDPIDECKIDEGYLNPNSFLGQALKPVTQLDFPYMDYASCKENVNLTTKVVRELMDKHLLNYGARALCLGQESASAVLTLRKLGFSTVVGFRRHPFFSLKQKQVIYKLDFEPNSFDFVIVRGLDKVSAPASLVNEVEHVLKPGGIAATLVEIDRSNAGTMVKAATPVSSFLKSSRVVHVASLKGHTLVVSKKNFLHVNSLVQYSLPANCPSLRRNKPFIDQMEPLVDATTVRHGGRITFLPSFVDMSSKMRLVYIDMGEKEVANFSHSNWFLPSYPVDSRAFNVYIVDHNALVLSSHVRRPGVTFIYHPGLNVNSTTVISNLQTVQDPEFPSSNDEEDFDFLAWFRETVLHSDFVILKMNAGRAELKFLLELFESGAICSVDELFLQCSDLDGSGFGGSCMDLFKGLRGIGVFVHQWRGN